MDLPFSGEQLDPRISVRARNSDRRPRAVARRGRVGCADDNCRDRRAAARCRNANRISRSFNALRSTTVAGTALASLLDRAVCDANRTLAGIVNREGTTPMIREHGTLIVWP